MVGSRSLGQWLPWIIWLSLVTTCCSQMVRCKRRSFGFRQYIHNCDAVAFPHVMLTRESRSLLVEGDVTNDCCIVRMPLISSLYVYYRLMAGWPWRARRCCHVCGARWSAVSFSSLPQVCIVYMLGLSLYTTSHVFPRGCAD